MVGSAALTFGSFAAPIAMVGVVWPDVRDRFGQSLGTLGLVSLVYGLARMSTSGSGRVVGRRVGVGTAFVASLGCLIAADLVVAGATRWAAFLVGIVGVGVVSGLLDSLGAGVVATLGDVGDSGLIHGAYGVGATIGPLAVAVVPDWRWSFVLAAMLAGAAVVPAVAVRRSWPLPPDDGDREKRDDADHGHDAGGSVTDPGRTTRGRAAGSAAARGRPAPGVVVSLTVFALFVAAEVTFGNWGFTYLTEARSISDGAAAIGVSGYWAGTTAGRLGLAWGPFRALVDRLGLVVLVVAALAAVVAASVAPVGLVVVATTAAGTCVAPVVPTLAARTAGRVGTRLASRVAGWQLLAANVGAIGVPAATGLLVDRVGPAVVIVVVASTLAVGIGPLVVARRITRTEPGTATASTSPA